MNCTYPDQTPLPATTETESVIYRRRSIRTYRKQQVPEVLIHRIIEAGRFAPSAGNYQPWKFIVVRDAEILAGITDTVVQSCQKLSKILDYRRPGFGWLRPFANIFIRLKLNELHPTPFGAITLIARRQLDLFHGAPTVIFIFKDVRGVSNPDLDCGIAGQNMVLAAHSLGLGTCWVGFAKLAFDQGRKWRDHFDLRFPYRFATSLAIGWPKGNPDGKVERQTPLVDWYEDGLKKLWIGDTAAVGCNAETIEWQERLRIPKYDDPSQIEPGSIRIDPEKCNTCGLCARACPAKAIQVTDSHAEMLTVNECVFCGDCKAICAQEAIRLERPNRCTGYYKTINKGEPRGPLYQLNRS